MSTQLKLRRGTTAQHSTFTGASGEITIDTDKKTVVVHDGTTAGGRALPQFDSSGNLGIGMTPVDSYTRIQASGAIGSYYGNGTVRTTLYSANGYAIVGTSTNHSLQLMTNGTTQATIDTSGNLGIGVTPSAWNSNYRALEFSFGCVGGNASGVETSLLSNCYRAADGKYYYKKNGYAAQLILNDGSGNTTSLFYASNGTAGTKVNSGTGDMTAAWTVDGSGNLLVGTTSKVGTERFNATGDTNDIVARIKNANANPSGLEISFSTVAPNNTSNSFLSCWDSTTSCFTVWSNGTTSGRSDAKLKKNITDASPKLDDVCQLKVRNYEWIDSIDGSKEIGFIAQEMEEVFPSLIIDQPDYEEITKTKTVEVPAVLDEEGNEVEPATTKEEEYTERVATGTTTKQIKHSVLVPILVKAIQEQQAIIESQAQTIESLTQRIEALEYTKQGE